MFATRMMMAASQAPMVSILGWDSAGDETNLSEYTFSAVNLQAASATKKIVILVGGSGTGAPTVDAVTVDGTSANVLKNVTGGATYRVAAAIASVSSTSGDVVVTFSGTMDRADIAVLALDNVGSTVYDEDFSDQTANPYTGSFDVNAGGIGIGISYDNNGTTYTWTGITEGVDAQIASTISAAASVFTSAQTVAATAQPASPLGGACYFFSLDVA